MNKMLRAEEFDPYSTIFESGIVKRRVFTFRTQRALSAAGRLGEQTSFQDTTPTFDAKQNLRAVRSVAPMASKRVDADLIAMAEAALSRQDSTISAGNLDQSVEILASDLAKIFD